MITTLRTKFETVKKHLATIHSTKYSFRGWRTLFERRGFRPILSVSRTNGRVTGVVTRTWHGVVCHRHLRRRFWFMMRQRRYLIVVGIIAGKRVILSCITWSKLVDETSPGTVGPRANTRTLTFRVPCLFVTMAGTHRGWWLWRGP